MSPRRLLAAVLLGLVGWAVGCTSRIHPPKEPQNGVAVYLVDAACHSGVVLPDGPDRWIEYGFGEYEWYANDRNAWYRVFPCVFWGTQGTLGRRQFQASSDDAVRRRAHADQVHRIIVEESRANALRLRLAEVFAAGGEPQYRPRYNMFFVEQGSYWFLKNCHDATAGWFQELGCEVTWRPLRTAIKLAPEPE